MVSRNRFLFPLPGNGDPVLEAKERLTLISKKPQVGGQEEGGNGCNRLIAFNTSLFHFFIFLWIEFNKSTGKLQFMVKFSFSILYRLQVGSAWGIKLYGRH
jgi:hypothetical protein